MRPPSRSKAEPGTMTTSKAAGSTSGRPARGSGMPKRPGFRSRSLSADGEGLHVMRPDDARQGDGDAACEAPGDERRRVDLAAKRGEAEHGGGVGDGRHGGEAGKERRAGGAALFARHGVAPAQHEIAQGALGRGGLVARLDYAERVCGHLHRSSASILVVYSARVASIAGPRRHLQARPVNGQPARQGGPHEGWASWPYALARS